MSQIILGSIPDMDGRFEQIIFNEDAESWKSEDDMIALQDEVDRILSETQAAVELARLNILALDPDIEIG